jgi:hypothetical protein
MELGFDANDVYTSVNSIPDIDSHTKGVVNMIVHAIKNSLDPWDVIKPEEREDFINRHRNNAFSNENDLDMKIASFFPIVPFISPSGDELCVKFLSRIIMDTDVYTPGPDVRLGTKFCHRPIVEFKDLPLKTIDFGDGVVVNQFDGYAADDKSFFAHEFTRRSSRGTSHDTINGGQLSMKMPFGMIKTAHFIDVTNNIDYFNFFGPYLNKILEKAKLGADPKAPGGTAITARWKNPLDED